MGSHCYWALMHLSSRCEEHNTSSSSWHLQRKKHRTPIASSRAKRSRSTPTQTLQTALLERRTSSLARLLRLLSAAMFSLERNKRRNACTPSLEDVQMTTLQLLKSTDCNNIIKWEWPWSYNKSASATSADNLGHLKWKLTPFEEGVQLLSGTGTVEGQTWADAVARSNLHSSTVSSG